ncbi:AAA family ATPase [Pseudomonas sp. GLN_6]|uniref:AAA family ATPase n=1 Tax=Pseudomonas sp. GLN_6 TaxID=3367183 RepID=UPI003709FDB6
MDNRQLLLQLGEHLNAGIVGQQELVEGLLLALLADGHLLVEGFPGLAKTRAIKRLGELLEADFARLQFTPDLLPSDITGAEQYLGELGQGHLEFRRGPLFANLVLADEVNRAPAKVQSALLEAMEERQVTVAGQRHGLPALFLVMATQNPLEQEGTYPLPEAQLDRFLMQLNVGYPDSDAELAMLRLVRGEHQAQTVGQVPRLSQATLLAARGEVDQVHVSPNIERYMLDLVRATRCAERYDAELKGYIEVGVSPRGLIALDRVARARAWLRGGDFVIPEDVRASVLPVLRHRMMLSYTAQAAGLDSDTVLQRLLQRVAVA